jgi:mutator protein MutT
MEEKNLSRPIPVVRLIVTDSSGLALILRRAADSTGGGAWCLPGGKIDYGETVEQAAARELQEETGLRGRALRFLFYQDSLPPAPGLMHCINFYLECEVGGGLALNPESTDSAWIGPEDLSRYQIAFRNDEGLRRYWSERACSLRTHKD